MQFKNNYSRYEFDLRSVMSPWGTSRVEVNDVELSFIVKRSVSCLSAGRFRPTLMRLLTSSCTDPAFNRIAHIDTTLAVELTKSLNTHSQALANGTVDEHILNLICLPSACLALMPPGTQITTTDLALLLGEAESLSQFVDIQNDAYQTYQGGFSFIGNPVTSKWFGQDPLAHTLAVLCAMQAILTRFFSDSFAACPAFSDQEISALSRRARNLQRRCWRTLRGLRQDRSIPTHELAPHLNLVRLEASALAWLAQFERLCGSHSRALQFAAWATVQIPFFTRNPCELRLFNSLKRYLEFNGLNVALMCYLPSIDAAQEDRPYLAMLVAASSPTTSNSVNALRTYGVKLEGWGFRQIDEVLRNETRPEVRAEAFTLAINMGAVWLASKFFHISETNDSWIDDEKLMGWIDDQKHLTARALGKDGLMNYATVIAELSQSCAPWLENWRQRQLQGGLRKFIRESANMTKLFWNNINDLLFVNHVRLGLGYYAKKQGDYKAIRKVQANVKQTARLNEIDDSIDTLLQGQRSIVRCSDFKREIKSVISNDVMVSLHTRDGDSLSITASSAKKTRHRRFESTEKHEPDWHKRLKHFSEIASDCIVDAARIDETPTLFIAAHFRELLQEIIDFVLETNPNAHRIFLHADPMWNVLPWQYIMLHQMEFKEWLQQLCINKYPHRNREADNLVIWRVPGLQLGNSLPSHGLKPRDVVYDMDDTKFQEIQAVIREISLAKPDGFLSLLAHGGAVVDNARVFKLNGKTIDKDALNQFEGYPLTLLHICDGARVKNSPNEDDTLGLPGALLLQGVKVVVAAGLPVPVAKFEGIKVIERHFGQITDVTDLLAIEKRYALACKEHPEAALYTLYSDSVAPILMLPTDEDTHP